MSTCDTGDLTPVAPFDGSFEIDVTYEVDDNGLAIAVADATQSQSAIARITVISALRRDLISIMMSENSIQKTDLDGFVESYGPREVTGRWRSSQSSSDRGTAPFSSDARQRSS
jgi:hypothetical protein